MEGYGLRDSAGLVSENLTHCFYCAGTPSGSGGTVLAYVDWEHSSLAQDGADGDADIEPGGDQR